MKGLTMTKLRVILGVIAFSQFALGILCIFAANFFFTSIGLSAPPPNNNFMIGMLGARFLAYGFGLVVLARQNEPSRFWMWNMVGIQVIDLLLGLFYTVNGTLGLSTSAFPMFNAAAFAILLALFIPRTQNGAPA